MGSQGFLLEPAVSGRGQGTPWTSRKLIAGPSLMAEAATQGANCTSGAIWGSVSCSGILRHAAQLSLNQLGPATFRSLAKLLYPLSNSFVKHQAQNIWEWRTVLAVCWLLLSKKLRSCLDWNGGHIDRLKSSLSFPLHLPAWLYWVWLAWQPGVARICISTTASLPAWRCVLNQWRSSCDPTALSKITANKVSPLITLQTCVMIPGCVVFLYLVFGFLYLIHVFIPCLVVSYVLFFHVLCLMFWFSMPSCVL